MKKYSAKWWTHQIKNNSLAHWIYRDVGLHLVATSTITQDKLEDKQFDVNNLSHLELFEETESWHNKANFIADAKRKIEQGGLFFSLVEDKHLAFWGWEIAENKKSYFIHVDYAVEYPEKTSTLYSIYVSPAYRRQGLFTAGLQFMTRYAIEEIGSYLVSSAIYEGNYAALKGHIAAGFEEFALLKNRTKFGYHKYSLTYKDNRYKVSARQMDERLLRILRSD